MNCQDCKHYYYCIYAKIRYDCNCPLFRLKEELILNFGSCKRKMKNKDQERVLELIGNDARGEVFIDFLDIDLRNVKTSSLHLFYKVVDRNVLHLLVGQKVINEELSIRAKEAEGKMAEQAMIKKNLPLEKKIKDYEAKLKAKKTSDEE